MSNFCHSGYIFFAPNLFDRFEWIAPASMGYCICSAYSLLLATTNSISNSMLSSNNFIFTSHEAAKSWVALSFFGCDQTIYFWSIGTSTSILINVTLTLIITGRGHSLLFSLLLAVLFASEID